MQLGSAWCGEVWDRATPVRLGVVGCGTDGPVRHRAARCGTVRCDAAGCDANVSRETFRADFLSYHRQILHKHSPGRQKDQPDASSLFVNAHFGNHY